jgi:hypothetical protein
MMTGFMMIKDRFSHRIIMRELRENLSDFFA